jgi:translation initiation factor IF-1
MPTKQRQKPVVRGKQKDTHGKRKAVIVLAVTACIVVAVIYGFSSHKSIESPPKAPIDAMGDKKGDSDKTSTVERDPQIVLGKAKLEIESVDNKDILKVTIQKTTNRDGGDITYRYEWSKNDQPVGDNSNSLSGFKRGDRIAVKITPFDNEKQAGSPKTLTVEIQNTTPKVSEGKEIKNDGKILSYQVVATDPDGDILSYELLSGPEGMTIDNRSGIATWPLKGNNSGDYPVKVKITDGHGGETTYQLTATIPKEPPPPVTVPKKSP